MTIKTYSGFTYGHTITDENKYIQFSEDGGVTELTATIEIGSYTLGSFVNAIATAMNNVANVSNTYTTSLNRGDGRKITVSADGVFSLLVDTGTLVGAGAFGLMGFTGNSDLTGGTDYIGDSGSGSYFTPQFQLQKFVDFDNNVKNVQATVNESASGSIEVVSYGRVKYMECNIMFQTNIQQANGSYLQNDPNGESNLRDFLSYATSKAPLEFIPDVDNPSFLVNDCLLESTRESSKGVNFKVKEMYSKKMVGYFESGLLVFREII